MTNADDRAVHNALGDLASAGTLDEPTMYFLGRTRAVSLALSMCLASVLDTHSSALVLGDQRCKECLTPAPCRTRRCLADTVDLYRLG